MRKIYEAPRLEVEGRVVDLTSGGGPGNHLDKEFPVGTPRGKLTFS